MNESQAGQMIDLLKQINNQIAQISTKLNTNT